MDRLLWIAGGLASAVAGGCGCPIRRPSFAA
jgi:hypothetical protein